MPVYKVDEDLEAGVWGGAESGWSSDRVLLCLWVLLKSAKLLQWRRLILLL